jgi:hypothetical protein
VVTSAQQGKKPEAVKTATNPSEQGECPRMPWRPTITRKDADDVTSRHNRTAAKSDTSQATRQVPVSFIDSILVAIGLEDSRRDDEIEIAIRLIVSIQEA